MLVTLREIKDSVSNSELDIMQQEVVFTGVLQIEEVAEIKILVKPCLDNHLDEVAVAKREDEQQKRIERVEVAEKRLEEEQTGHVFEI